LCQRRDEYEGLNVRVLAISFGALPWAQAWQKETCPWFPLLLDRRRVAYRAYGLRRSWLGSWNLQTLRIYIRLLRAGRKWRGIQGDPAQLGGDFIVDSDGIVRLAYRSRDPADRPSVGELLTLLHQLDRGPGGG
jgi:peroxiredoxin